MLVWVCKHPDWVFEERRLEDDLRTTYGSFWRRFCHVLETFLPRPGDVFAQSQGTFSLRPGDVLRTF